MSESLKLAQKFQIDCKIINITLWRMVRFSFSYISFAFMSRDLELDRTVPGLQRTKSFTAAWISERLKAKES